MSDYIYYTPQELASLLIDLISQEQSISTVVDICCGSWNLLNAAKEKFPEAKLVGVDVDEESISHQIANTKFICCDGRDFANQQIQKNRHFDLILSNPPFGALRVEEKKYSIKGNVFAESKRYEAEMLWANYQLMSKDSTLVIILPSTYVDGSSYIKYRKWLAENCCIQKIVRLPHNTFAKSKPNTVALILKKRGAKQNVIGTDIFEASYHGIWEVSKIGTVSQTEVENGFWSTLCAYPVEKPAITIFRGNTSSKFFTNTGNEILHCSSLISRNCWRPSIRYCDSTGLSQKKYAKRGDIIINRIGRSAGYWCIYRGKKRLISDCLIVISSPSSLTVSKIKENSVCNRLSIPLRGVSTPYITMEDISNKLNSTP